MPAAAAKKLHWFPFDIDRWETDEFVKTSDFTEHGIYLALLCWQWREGSIPASIEKLKQGLSFATRLLQSNAEAETRLQRILVECFEDHPKQTGRLVNRVLFEIAEAQRVKSRSKSKAGRKGGISSGIAKRKQNGTEREVEEKKGLKKQQDLELGGSASQEKLKTKTDSNSSRAGAARKQTWLTPYDELWRRHFGASLPFGPAAKALRPLEQEHGSAAVLRALDNYLAAHTGERASYLSWPKFGATFGQWLNPKPATQGSSQSRSFDAIDRALGGEDDGD